MRKQISIVTLLATTMGLFAAAERFTKLSPEKAFSELKLYDAKAPLAQPKLVLLVSRFENANRDCAAITLASMCQEAGREFDVYYAADHKEGGLFSAHGSSVIGGQHGLRIARARPV